MARLRTPFEPLAEQPGLPDLLSMVATSGDSRLSIFGQRGRLIPVRRFVTAWQADEHIGAAAKQRCKSQKRRISESFNGEVYRCFMLKR